MIIVHDYFLEEGENGVWYVKVKDGFGNCDVCGIGMLKYRDSCLRVCRESDEKVKMLMIPRVKCTVCGKMQGKPGQPIKIPYGIHGRTAERSYFIGIKGEPVTYINHFVDGLAKTAPEVVKRIIAASCGVKNSHELIDVDNNLDAFGDITVSIKEVLSKCNLIRYLCQKIC